MKSSRRSLIARRLDRLLRWAGLWALRLAAWIVQVAGVSAPLERTVETLLRPKIDYVAKGVCKVIAAKAMLRLKLKARRADFGPGKAPAHFMRTVLGSRLRRLVKARDLRAKIAAILMLLRDAEKEIARFAKRVARGLMRRRGGVSRNSLKAKLIRASLRRSIHNTDTS